MDIRNKRVRLKALLEQNIRNEKIGTAIAITGSWGVGKTYFWNTFLESELSEERIYKKDNVFNRKYAYVSLFGLESLSDLKTQIYSSIENYHSTVEIPKWIKGLPSIFKDTKISQFGVSASAKIFDSLMFSQVKDAIICFDDFERMSNKLDIKDVMGLANQLKLERNCQVILILDESKTEEKNKEKYAEYKEKLIDETVKITSVEPLIRGNTKDIDKSLVDLMVKFADELEIHNFRFFQKVIKLYKQFLEKLPSEVADSTKEIILIRILQGYFIEDFGTIWNINWNDLNVSASLARIAGKGRGTTVQVEDKIFDKLKKVSFSLVNGGDEWQIQFKNWFQQKENVDFAVLYSLANSELISEENQNLKNKIWDIFDRRFNFNISEADFKFIAQIGAECISNETIYNTSVVYEFIKKYLSNEQESEKFKQDVLKVIHTDIGKAISRKKEELRLWGNPDNIFYEHIDKLAEEYHSEKSLKEIISYYLQYENFKSADDKKELNKFSLEEWFKYLTIDIYDEKFIVEKDKTLIACLRLLSNVSIDDISMKSIVVEVLNKIGEESEFKKNFMQDIIENHLD